MPDGWEETIEDLPEEFVAALWNLGREWNKLQDKLTAAENRGYRGAIQTLRNTDVQPGRNELELFLEGHHLELSYDTFATIAADYLETVAKEIERGV